jgi:hypothetical protein
VTNHRATEAIVTYPTTVFALPSSTTQATKKPRNVGKYFNFCGQLKALKGFERHINMLASMGVDFHSALEDFYENMNKCKILI